MIVFKCDICHKEFGREENRIEVGVRYGMGDYSLCMSCAEPVILFLKEKKLMGDKVE